MMFGMRLPKLPPPPPPVYASSQKQYDYAIASLGKTSHTNFNSFIKERSEYDPSRNLYIIHPYDVQLFCINMRNTRFIVRDEDGEESDIMLTEDFR